MSPPSCSFSFRTAPGTSAPSRCELFHSSGSDSVVEATYFGIELNLSAKPASSVRPGHAAAKPSYVLRPSSSAPLDIVSVVLYSPTSGLKNLKLQPPCSKFSDPPGSSITPSALMNSVTNTFLIICSFVRMFVVQTDAAARNHRDEFSGEIGSVWR